MNSGCSLNPGLLVQAGQYKWEFFFSRLNVNLSERMEDMVDEHEGCLHGLE